MRMTLKSRTVKAYAIALALIWLYTIAGVFFAAVCYPGTLTTSDDDRPAKTLNIRFAPATGDAP